MFEGISDYSIPKSNHEECRCIIQLLVHAESEEQYNELKLELFDKANDAFRTYFEDNWEGCRSMWVSFEQDQHMHFAIITNSQWESHNHKLKDLTSRSPYCLICFNVLLYACHSAE